MSYQRLGWFAERMIIPTPVATIVLGVTLSALLWCDGIELAAAGSVAATSGAATTSPEAAQPAVVPHGRAYLFRGAMGPIFSRGMDRLTERIEQVGITANVYEFTICRIIAANAIREYRENPAPIILIGHSMGGYCALIFSELLEAENIPVGLVVTIDPPQVSPDVPLNIGRYINIFLSKSVFGGSHMKPKPGYRNHYASFDLSEHEEVSHINIEKMDAIIKKVTSPANRIGTFLGAANRETAQIVVGGSAFAERSARDEVDGKVFFLDRDYRRFAEVPVVAPPMEIRRIDGRDRSLSTHLASIGATASIP